MCAIRVYSDMFAGYSHTHTHTRAGSYLCYSRILLLLFQYISLVSHSHIGRLLHVHFTWYTVFILRIYIHASYYANGVFEATVWPTNTYIHNVYTRFCVILYARVYDIRIVYANRSVSTKTSCSARISLCIPLWSQRSLKPLPRSTISPLVWCCTQTYLSTYICRCMDAGKIKLPFFIFIFLFQTRRDAFVYELSLLSIRLRLIRDSIV